MSSTQRLSAIISADIEGYTALMQKDEALAKILLDKFQLCIKNICSKYDGRIIELIGDGAFCVFANAVEAVRASIAIQQEMMRDPKVRLRIGIHYGTVLFEYDKVYGDELDIVSSIESLGVAGSILISEKVLEEIKSQQDIKCISLGVVHLRNVKTPMAIAAINNPGLVVPGKKDLKRKILRSAPWLSSYKKWTMIFLATAFLVAGCWIVYTQFIVKPQTKIREKSIAVLPFSNLSTDKKDEYFANEICREIINQLTRISDLKVIWVKPAGQYKNSEPTIADIAKELNVEYVLRGSVQKASDKIRISLQLVNANENEIIWANTYYRSMEDIFTIQRDVANEVVNELHAKLSTNEKRLIDAVPTTNAAAYQNYLQGNYFLDKRTSDEMLRAKEYFEKAISSDSGFYAAYVGLACSYIFRSNFYCINPGEGYPVAKKLIAKSLSADPDLADAHAALGIVYGFHDWDFPLAEKEFRRALSLDRNNKMAIVGYGRCLYSSRKFKDALDLYNAALKQDPLWRQPLNSIAWVYFFKANYDSALLYIRKNQELNPDFFQPYRLGGLIDLQQERSTEAIQQFLKAVALSNNNPEELAYLGYGYAKTRNDTEAEKIIETLKKEQGNSRILSFPIAMVYAGFENKSKTFEYLQMALEEKTADIMLVHVFPQFDFLRHDDQYQEFIQNAGIVFLD
ncbi:MAG: adenylate/guanylate cyclase domain-containing protein [Chitinophagales bacterium]